jgi:hypothetical protein
MPVRTLAVIVLRIWGVLLLGWTLATVPMNLFIATLAARGQINDIPGRPAGVVVHLLAGMALMVLADPIARHAMPGVSSTDAGVSATQLGILALTLVAIFLLVDGLQTSAVAGYGLAARPHGLPAATVMERLREGQREGIARSIPMIATGAAILWRDRLGRAHAAARRARGGD